MKNYIKTINHFKGLFSVILLITAFNITACRKQAVEATDPENSAQKVLKNVEQGLVEYRAKVLKLKASGLEGDSLEKKTLELRTQLYKAFPVLSESDKTPAPLLQKRLESMSQEGGPLAMAAMPAILPDVRRDYEQYYGPTHSAQIYVGAGQTVKIQTYANFRTTVDPFVVLFLREPSGRYNIRILAYNDDGLPNLHANAYWYNNTGTGKWVYYIVFSANATAGVGQTHLKVMLDDVIKDNSLYVPVYGYGSNVNNLPGSDLNYSNYCIGAANPDAFPFPSFSMFGMNVLNGVWRGNWVEGPMRVGGLQDPYKEYCGKLTSGGSNFLIVYKGSFGSGLTYSPTIHQYLQATY